MTYFFLSMFLKRFGGGQTGVWKLEVCFFIFLSFGKGRGENEVFWVHCWVQLALCCFAWVLFFYFFTCLGS